MRKDLLQLYRPDNQNYERYLSLKIMCRGGKHRILLELNRFENLSNILGISHENLIL
jgi:hypothetical protein